MSASASPADLLATARAAYCDGQIATLLALQATMVEALPRYAEDDEAEARCLAAHVSNLMLSKTQALELLEPYVTRVTSRVSLAEPEMPLDTSRLHAAVRSSVLKGMILMEAARAQYRAFAFADGVTTAEEAVRLLEEPAITAPAYGELPLFLARIYLARLRWHRHDQPTAEDGVRDVLEALNTPGSLSRGAALLLRGMCYDLLASWYWAGGLTRKGQLSALRAIRALSSREIDDPIRKGHAGYMASLLDAADPTVSRAQVIRDLDATAGPLHDLCHPYEGRVRALKAQLYVRTRSPNASQALDEARVVAEAINDVEERDFVLGMCALAEVWLLEREALQTDDWQHCARVGSRATADARHPHLQAEFCLHHGRALFGVGQIENARKQLRKAKTIASRDGRSKVLIGCLLGLADTWISTRSAHALRLLRRAERRLTRTRSTYLEEWRDAVRRRLRERACIEIQPDQTFDEAYGEFLSQYVGFFQQQKLDESERQRRTGLKYKTWIRRCNEVQLYRAKRPEWIKDRRRARDNRREAQVARNLGNRQP